MKINTLSSLTAALTAAALVGAATPASAFSFKTNFEGNDPKGNIILKSVEFNGLEFSNFAFVQSVSNLVNPPYTGGNSGAASTDLGDKVDLSQYNFRSEDPTTVQIAKALGNNNLNSIIDGEDRGAFSMDLDFGRAVSNLFVWERGKNSWLGFQALDANGNAIGNKLEVYSRHFDNAGYSIDTLEIGGAQTVGSRGISIAELGVSGPISKVRVYARQDFNGPDFKVVGGATEAVPEPMTMGGLALAGAGLAYARRRRQIARG